MKKLRLKDVKVKSFITKPSNVRGGGEETNREQCTIVGLCECSFDCLAMM